MLFKRLKKNMDTDAVFNVSLNGAGVKAGNNINITSGTNGLQTINVNSDIILSSIDTSSNSLNIKSETNFSNPISVVDSIKVKDTTGNKYTTLSQNNSALELTNTYGDILFKPMQVSSPISIYDFYTRFNSLNYDFSSLNSSFNKFLNDKKLAIPPADMKYWDRKFLTAVADPDDYSGSTIIITPADEVFFDALTQEKLQGLLNDDVYVGIEVKETGLTITIRNTSSVGVSFIKKSVSFFASDQSSSQPNWNDTNQETFNVSPNSTQFIDIDNNVDAVYNDSSEIWGIINFDVIINTQRLQFIKNYNFKNSLGFIDSMSFNTNKMYATAKQER